MKSTLQTNQVAFITSPILVKIVTGVFFLLSIVLFILLIIEEAAWQTKLTGYILGLVVLLYSVMQLRDSWKVTILTKECIQDYFLFFKVSIKISSITSIERKKTSQFLNCVQGYKYIVKTKKRNICITDSKKMTYSASSALKTALRQNGEIGRIQEIMRSIQTDKDDSKTQ